MNRASIALAAAWLLPVAWLMPETALADVDHVVARGHTLEAIANRYHVAPKEIASRNHLSDPKKLRVGTVLVIPGVKAKTSAKSDGKDAPGGKRAGKAKSYASRPKEPGVIHATRLGTHEPFTLRLSRGRPSPGTMKRVEQMMRAPSGESHAVEPRLVALLRVVSDHFGGRPIEVVSGYRPKTPTQYNPHSQHNHGKAIDFRVVGVPNEAVRDFCRTLRNTGCGYYPNSVFVHMDVREQSTYWVDWSKPGQRPNYAGPDVGADEGASEVHDEVHRETGATPPSASDNTPPSATAPAPSTTGEPTAPAAAPSAPPSPADAKAKVVSDE